MPNDAAPPPAMTLTTAEVREATAAFGRCRGHALGVGVMTLILSTSDEIDEAACQELDYCVAAYRETVEAALVGEVERLLGAALPADVALVRGFGAALPLTEAARREVGRPEALTLTWTARREVLPALYRCIDLLHGMDTDVQQARLAAMGRRNAELEAMFSEMEKVGRAIRLISLNAAVEAARTGGASGRAFGVIATEVRTLATRAADLLSRARRSIAHDGEARP